MDVNRYTRIGVVSAAEGQFQPEILAEAKMGHIDEAGHRASGHRRSIARKSANGGPGHDRFLKDLSVWFGGVQALKNVSVSIDAPLVGIIGPNGAGKTTLLNVLSGFITPRTGSLHAFGTDLGVFCPRPGGHADACGAPSA